MRPASSSLRASTAMVAAPQLTVMRLQAPVVEKSCEAIERRILSAASVAPCSSVSGSTIAKCGGPSASRKRTVIAHGAVRLLADQGVDERRVPDARGRVDDPEKGAGGVIALAVTARRAVLRGLRQLGIAVPAGGHGRHSRHQAPQGRPQNTWESEFVYGRPGGALPASLRPGAERTARDEAAAEEV